MSQIMFCPKCGSLMKPKRINGKLYMVCPKCGYKVEADPKKVSSSLKMKETIQHTPKDKTIVVDAEALPPTAQVLKGVAICPKCGNDEVIVWMVQTRAADEPPTRFYRCTKCGYTWREYA
ncbi:MAG: transcription factor S [Caldisphaeraceae archaeon]|nr:transcription factor S [Caldisphaeraceae archaeon]